MRPTITSVHNERVKYIRSLHRRRARQGEGRFVVEGRRLVEEVVRAGIMPVLVLYTEPWVQSAGAADLLALLQQCEMGVWEVSEAVMAAASVTETPPGLLAVAPFAQRPHRPGLVLILDGLRDPGNLGTILRSSVAAGVGQVILAPGTVDLYNPKVVRGAMGAHFRLSAEALLWPTIARRVAGRTVWLADTLGAVAYDEVDWTQPSALIVGGEALGAGADARSLSTGSVRIPMSAETESLNAAMAATVLLFEAARQIRF